MFYLQPKGGLDFAAELAAKIGVAPVKKPDSDQDDDDDKVSTGEWSDEEHQVPQTAEVQEKQHSLKKSRSDTSSSKSKDKKSHHHHHHHHDKKDRSESHGEHKHRKRHSSKTSHSSVDTRQSVPAEDGEKSGSFIYLLWAFPMCNFYLIIFKLSLL